MATVQMVPTILEKASTEPREGIRSSRRPKKASATEDLVAEAYTWTTARSRGLSITMHEGRHEWPFPHCISDLPSHTWENMHAILVGPKSHLHCEGEPKVCPFISECQMMLRNLSQSPELTKISKLFWSLRHFNDLKSTGSSSSRSELSCSLKDKLVRRLN
ncbi:uncharacterized protein A4U43_UnF8630 [Asparagus officinalis]|uniref:Uncharacterized protein n=1 Tax=Asparagus officinalis TaxID=4686 RepID=A0A1R3L5W9_ASPOF|nr:uncharacterized protein A4U43_UnF8630 [Asparagus officinalis]